MKEIKVWYTIEKYEGRWTVWKYKEGKYSYGSLGIYSSDKKQDCLDYCKRNKIKVGKRYKKWMD